MSGLGDLLGEQGTTLGPELNFTKMAMAMIWGTFVHKMVGLGNLLGK